jgi:Protein of unknown function (DUF3297)
MTSALPDRLSINPTSPFYNEALLEQGIGIKFKGVEKFNVEEYCISERWVKVAAGKAKDRHGNSLTIKLTGDIEAWIKNPVVDVVNSDETVKNSAE